MSEEPLTEADASAILRKLDERVRRIDTRVTIIGNAVGAPFNVNTQPRMLPNGRLNLPSRHTTLSDILLAIGDRKDEVGLVLGGVLVGTVRKR